MAGGKAMKDWLVPKRDTDVVAFYLFPRMRTERPFRPCDPDSAAATRRRPIGLAGTLYG